MKKSLIHGSYEIWATEMTYLFILGSPLSHCPHAASLEQHWKVPLPQTVLATCQSQQRFRASIFATENLSLLFRFDSFHPTHPVVLDGCKIQVMKPHRAWRWSTVPGLLGVKASALASNCCKVLNLPVTLIPSFNKWKCVNLVEIWGISHVQSQPCFSMLPLHTGRRPQH